MKFMFLLLKGDIIDLPKDSTPIDFAFALHSDIGLHCSGCRINKNLAPLSVPFRKWSDSRNYYG